MLKNRIEQLERTLRISLISPEMEVLLHLHRNRGTSSHRLMGVSRLSAAGFHIVRRRLCDRGVIEGVRSERDSRKVIYDLAPHVRAEFDHFMQIIGAPGDLERARMESKPAVRVSHEQGAAA